MRPNEESSTASGAQASASGSSTAARASTSSRATRPAAGSASTKKTIEGTRRPTRPSGQARVARSTRKCSGAPPRSTKTLWTMSPGDPRANACVTISSACSGSHQTAGSASAIAIAAAPSQAIAVQSARP